MWIPIVREGQMIRVEAHNPALDRLRAISRVIRCVRERLSLPEVALISAKELVPLTGSDGCAILKVDGNSVELLAQSGAGQPDWPKIDFTNPIVRYTMRTGKGLATGNIHAGPASGLAATGIKVGSLISVPIIVDVEVKGILLAYATRYDAFTDNDVYSCWEIARELSLAFRYAGLHEQMSHLPRIETPPARYYRYPVSATAVPA